jgi:hypothetical protein
LASLVVRFVAEEPRTNMLGDGPQPAIVSSSARRQSGGERGEVGLGLLGSIRVFTGTPLSRRIRHSYLRFSG